MQATSELIGRPDYSIRLLTIFNYIFPSKACTLAAQRGCLLNGLDSDGALRMAEVSEGFGELMAADGCPMASHKGY